MFYIVLLKVFYVSFTCCFQYNSLSFQKYNLPTHVNLSLNLFDEIDLETVNPRAKIKKRKPRPIYILDDPLTKCRIDNFGKNRDSTTLNLTSLPYVEIEHQDKNKLVPYKDGRDILSYYSNKLISFLSNYREWKKAYDTDSSDLGDLEKYNPISPNTYYALVFYCAWQPESIALVKAIRQLLGHFYYTRDPPIVHKKVAPNLEDALKKYEEIKRLQEAYEKEVEEAKSKNLPIPPEPDFDQPEPVKFKMNIPDVKETLEILEYSQELYKYKWWMPMLGKLSYNRIVDKAFNELYNTSYKNVKSIEERKKYRLMDLKRVVTSYKKVSKRPINLNFVFVRLANSMMLSNSKRGLKRHKHFIQCHEKEFRFNEIMLRLLIEEGIYYENMPVIQLFKCTEPLDAIPHVYGSKTNEVIPFEKHLNFYKRNPFEISQFVNYGLPKLRKCNHLTVMDDFVHLGNFMNFQNLRDIDSYDFLFISDSEFTNLFNKSRNINSDDYSRLEPVLHALTMMYRHHLLKIIDSRPKEKEYLILNP